MRIGILEHKDFSQKAINELFKLGKVSLFENNPKVFFADIEILFVRLKHFIGEEIINKTPKLKYICSPTTGLNHIDIEICKAKNIKIISLKGKNKFLSNIRATPEHTFGLVLALLRNYKNTFLNSENNTWDRDKYKGFELFKSKIGIIGLGRVGKILAKYFEAFDAEIFYYDIDNEIKSEQNIIKINSLEELISKTEIIILSASYNGTIIIKEKHLDLMKNKYFINTARGELIDEKSLIKKIKKKHFKGIAIDVINNETGNNNLKDLLALTKNRNLIITPHISGATFSSMNRTEEFIVEKLEFELKNNKI